MLRPGTKARQFWDVLALEAVETPLDERPLWVSGSHNTADNSTGWYAK
jgi:hypothetical protein